MPDHLRDKVRTCLPPDILSLLDEIEACANTAIEITENQKPASATDPNPLAPASLVYHDGACILLRDTDNIDPNGILHELLHIQRYWVDGVPQVLPLGGDPNQLRVTGEIENALEHLVVIPKEAEYGFDPFPYWNETARRNWLEFPRPEMTDEVRRRACLLGRLGLAHVNDDDVLHLVAERIHAQGLTGETERFNKRIWKLIRSKPRSVSCVLRFLRIPREEAKLVFFDIQKRERRETVLPAH